MNKISLAFAIALISLMGRNGKAEATGPVASSCKTEIEKFCAGIEHGRGAVRACLEAKKDELSESCKKALETTGPGRGSGSGRM